MSVSRTDFLNGDTVSASAAAEKIANIAQAVEKPADSRVRLELRTPRANAALVAGAARQIDGDPGASPRSDAPVAATQPPSSLDRNREAEMRRAPLSSNPANATPPADTARGISPNGLSAARAAPAIPRPPMDVQSEVARFFAGLQGDLKKTIAEEVAREIGSLRAEIRKSDAEDRHYATSTREDLANLTDSINQLSRHSDQEAAALSPRIAEIRLLMDGLARDASMQNIEICWERIDRELQAIGAANLREELGAIANQTKGIRHQLDEKLALIMATAEQITLEMKPANGEIVAQMSAITSRLDKLSLTMSASGRSSLSATETTLMQRLENRICGLADKIDLMSSEAMLRYQPTSDLLTKIDRLAERIDRMGQSETSVGLDARLDAIARQIDRSQKTAAPPLDITRHLAAISKKIDALDQIGASNEGLTEKLDYLARRIDEVDLQPTGVGQILGEAVVGRLEDRLVDVAIRLEEFHSLPPGEAKSSGELEHQMKRLTTLLGEAWGEFGALPEEFNRHMAAMEAFVANNDEFIIQAAHQAAEAVAQSNSSGSAGVDGEPSLAALAQDLRHLEEIGRTAGERTHRTFEALHDTLIQIAERLAHMEERISAEVEKQGNLSGELLEEIMKAELVSALNQEKPKSGLLAGISRRFSQAG